MRLDEDYSLLEFDAMGSGEEEEPKRFGSILTTAFRLRVKDSKLVNSVVWNNNYYTRLKKFDKVFVHIMVARWTGKRCGEYFRTSKVSSNYQIGYEGDINQAVEEKYGAWAQGSKKWNQRAVSIELANTSIKDKDYPVSDETLESCIELVADIFIRNKMGKVKYTGDLNGNLCKHKWVAGTSCPGAFMDKKFDHLAEEANKIIDGELRLPERGYFVKGDHGRSVRILQRWLRKQGLYNGSYKGAFGTYKSVTEKAVKKFQKKYGLKVDGEFGKDCLKKAMELEAEK